MDSPINPGTRPGVISPPAILLPVPSGELAAANAAGANITGAAAKLANGSGGRATAAIKPPSTDLYAQLKAAEIKERAAGRWVDILPALGGIDCALLDGRHHACPRCGGTDRFRAIDIEHGVVLCNQCFSKKNGDGLAALMWLTGQALPETLRLIASHLGINGNANGNGRAVDVLTRVAREKRVSVESFQAYGATIDRGAVAFPVFAPDGTQCSTFSIRPGDKGRFEKGKKAGLFLPVANGLARQPQAGETWHLAEGVKDSAALHGLGLLAVGLNTCRLAKKFQRLFRGVDVLIVPDRDAAGTAGAEHTARVLYGVAASVRVAALPAEFKETDGADVRDVLALADGETLLRQAIVDAQPWTRQPTNRPQLDNTKPSRNGRDPKTIAEILADVGKQTNDWPRRVENSLFYESGGFIGWLPNQSSLFGWLGSRVGRIDWHRSTGCVSRSEVFEQLRNTAKKYAAIEQLPHEPMMADHYYTCGVPAPGDGKAMRGLVARFRPATTVDSDLLLAAIVTLFWGGEGGTRPAFVLTADAGRGAGKTKTAEAITYVAGGHIDVSCQEEIGQVKQRLLTPAALLIRAAMLDNVKTLKFSWAEMESLITSRVVSGKRMYAGEAQRPNTVTWFITLNGVSLATDMAQRTVIIQLAKGPNQAAWFEETLAYIDKHRAAIVADCVAFLRSPAAKLVNYSRWASWERDILSRLSNPTEAQAVIAERQGASDAETDEVDIVEGYFFERLAWLGYDPAAEVVRLPVQVVAEWYCSATRERLRTTGVSRHLTQLATEGKLNRISRDSGRAFGRCFLWTGQGATCNTPIANDLCDRINAKRQDSQGTF